MGKIIGFFYSALIVLVALDAIVFEFIPSNYLSFVVIIIGFLVLLTPVERRFSSHPDYRVDNILNRSSRRTGWFRRWFLGIVLVILGVASTGSIEELGVFGDFTLNTLTGQLILLFIGIIYYIGYLNKGYTMYGLPR